MDSYYTDYSCAMEHLRLSTLVIKREQLCLKFAGSLTVSEPIDVYNILPIFGMLTTLKTPVEHSPIRPPELGPNSPQPWLGVGREQGWPVFDQEPARDLTAARPNCKSRSAPYHTPHGSRRATDRAPDGSLTETGRKIRRTLGVMTPAGVYAEDMPNGRRFKCDLSITGVPNKTLVGVVWRSDSVLDSEPRGPGFES
ncbi:hypothetical protein Bbelb_329730 [Branchiostoma belcheri]|nr:hypothetical protein Bbelb_329730 [Branchiostoma belcheri]